MTIELQAREQDDFSYPNGSFFESGVAVHPIYYLEQVRSGSQRIAVRKGFKSKEEAIKWFESQKKGAVLEHATFNCGLSESGIGFTAEEMNESPYFFRGTPNRMITSSPVALQFSQKGSRK